MLMLSGPYGIVAKQATVNTNATTWGDTDAARIGIFIGTGIASHKKLGEVVENIRQLAQAITVKPAAAPGVGNVAVYSLTAGQVPRQYARATPAAATAVIETQYGITVGNTAAAKLGRSVLVTDVVEQLLIRLWDSIGRKA